MNNDLESKLKHALRPVAPSDAFTQPLLARVAASRDSRPQARPTASRITRRAAWWTSAALAASVLAAVGIQHQLQTERERTLGLQARRQVIEALRVTSQKLDLAYQAVRTQSVGGDRDSGV